MFYGRLLFSYRRPHRTTNVFKKKHFTYHAQSDTYTCPNEHVLVYKTTTRQGYREYHSDPKQCQHCPIRSDCTSSQNMKKVITRHIYQQAVEQANLVRLSPYGKRTLKRRAQWVGICGVHLQPLVDALRQHLLAQPVLHADETPVRMLSPGNGKTHQAYLWAYTSTAFSTLKGVIYDFTEGRAGRHAQQFLGQWQGTLVCDDYAGYKVLFQEGPIIESGCWAHARRKFFDVYQANKSELANYALAQIQQLYLTERDVQALKPEQRHQHRQTHMKPILDKLHQWMQEQSLLVPPKSAILKALMYSLNRWQALTRFVDDARLPMDNNAVENLMRPIALGRKNWLFAGSLRAGMRAAAIMSLLQSAKLNGLDVHAYLTDVLTRLPAHKASQIDELLPHNWQPSPT